MNSLDIYEILKHLPHRYPFLLVDSLEEMEEGKRVFGYKNVTINEPFFQGHFPGIPIMPGVLIVEAMAQAGGVLIAESVDLESMGALIYFMSIDKVRFRRPVRPGDTLDMATTLTRRRGPIGEGKGAATVDGAVWKC